MVDQTGRDAALIQGLKGLRSLTQWGRVTHICISDLTSIGSDNGLSPGRRQAIIWTNAGILLIGPLGTNFSENSIEILTFQFMKMRLKVSSAKWRPFCLSLNVLSVSLSKFDGSVDVNDWLDNFDTYYAEVDRTSEANKLYDMVSHLSGEAKEWYRSQPPATRDRLIWSSRCI